MEGSYSSKFAKLCWKRTILPILLILTGFSTTHGQAGGIYGHGREIHQRFYDYNRWIHFGFVLGTNFANFKHEYSDYWYHQDTIRTVKFKRLPGFSIGAVVDVHMGENFDLRLIFPTLVLAQRNVNFTLYDGKTPRKEVESAFLEVPLLLKYKSERYDNHRFYVIGGAKYSYDFAADYDAIKEPGNPKIALTPHTYSYEFGMGLDIYFQYFKFSPEIKLSKGINNVLSPDDAIISRIFNRFRSNGIYFSMYFEG